MQICFDFVSVHTSTGELWQLMLHQPSPAALTDGCYLHAAALLPVAKAGMSDS